MCTFNTEWFGSVLSRNLTNLFRELISYSSRGIIRILSREIDHMAGLFVSQSFAFFDGILSRFEFLSLPLVPCCFRHNSEKEGKRSLSQKNPLPSLAKKSNILKM